MKFPGFEQRSLLHRAVVTRSSKAKPIHRDIALTAYSSRHRTTDVSLWSAPEIASAHNINLGMFDKSRSTVWPLVDTHRKPWEEDCRPFGQAHFERPSTSHQCLTGVGNHNRYAVLGASYLWSCSDMKAKLGHQDNTSLDP